MLFISVYCFAQETKTVEVKGVAPTRDEAIQDGLRMAVGKAVGTYVISEKVVENFMPIKDAVMTRSNGYIASYEVINETPLKDRYEVMLKADVSLEPLKQDVASLQQMLGSLTFVVLYDERKLNTEQKKMYEYAYERVNQKLTEHKYDITEAKLFKNLLKVFPENDTSEISFLNKMGLYTNSEFIIQIKEIDIKTFPKEKNINQTEIRIQIKAYDNCSWKVLGTVPLDKVVYWNSLTDDKDKVIQDALAAAIDNGLGNLLEPFNTYMGKWVNEGAPFELRYYTEIRYAEFSKFKEILKANPNFGGQLNMLSSGDYKKITLNFKLKQDELIDAVMAALSQVETITAKDLEPQIIYGRQISFAPYTEKIPQVKEKEETLEKANAQ